MSIRLLTQVLPYPPDAGPIVKVWQLLQNLHRGGRWVSRIMLVRPEEQLQRKAVARLLPVLVCRYPLGTSGRYYSETGGDQSVALAKASVVFPATT